LYEAHIKEMKQEMEEDSKQRVEDGWAKFTANKQK
jgi:hypothetical protein